MRIAYLLQAGVPELRRPPYSGPAVHVQHTVHELRELGHHVRILARYGNRIWYSTDLKDFKVFRVPMDQPIPSKTERLVRRVQSELRLPYAAWFDSQRFAQACRILAADCDIFFERMGWMGYGAGLAAQRLNIPLVLEVNGDHLEEYERLGLAPQGLQRRLSLALMKRAAQRATHVVATGQGWADRFIDRWHVSSERVSVVENGTSLVDLLNRSMLRAFRDLGGRPSIVYVGGLEPWHGVGILIEAFSRVIHRGTDAELKIIGDGAERDDLVQSVSHLNVSDNVSFMGHLELKQLAGVLQNADIGVSAYCGRAEFSGLKLLDYKAGGLATIASGRDGQPAVIVDGRTGIIVPPCDTEALSRAIERLCVERLLCREMGQTARREAEAQHSWQHTAEALELVFFEVIERG